MAQTALMTAAGGYILWKLLDSRMQLSSDGYLLPRLARAISQLKRAQADGLLTVDMWLQTIARQPPNREFLITDGRAYTFKQTEELSNQVARWALARGLKPGDTVSLVMENRPEYVIAWLGLTKVGVSIAFINTNLRQKALVHCIQLAQSKIVLFGSELADAIAEVRTDLPPEMQYVYWTAPGEAPARFGEDLAVAIASQSAEPIPRSARKGVTPMDTFGYIYTSGTTGLPKAAVIRHLRMWQFATGFVNANDVTDKDRVYISLPLYHSAGGAVGVGLGILAGAQLIIRRKFSATKFWQEVSEYKCTIVQYIGEVCRYLLAAPPTPYDKKHVVRVAIGNGLRPDIWEQFRQRYNIPMICEFYGATEGNVALMNLAKGPQDAGACGRLGLVGRKLLGYKIIKLDVVTEEPIRDKNGRCIECAPGEAGEMLGPIKQDVPTAIFSGYTDKKATEKKILRDVFVKGDAYFRTGDLLMQNSQGYFYFVDRIGDTFRWKGENVSTTEVAEAISVFPGIVEANVYGVQVPGKDGRACMAAVIYSDDTDLVGLAKHLKKSLPSYAVPLFLRRQAAFELTGTFKQQKVKLRDEGIQLDKVTDPILWLNPATGAYEPFGPEQYRAIAAGNAKL